MAIADLATPVPDSTHTPEILGTQGVLSARFATAPMQMATIAAATPVAHPLRELPGRKPIDPEPAPPPAMLATEARSSGTRLERVSLGEVRLVTLVDPPALPASRKPDFASFGERLSVWLPQSVAMEQSARVGRPDEKPMMLAAIERAQKGQALAELDVVETRALEQFAYIFFDTDPEIAAA
jgi:hypothetical protein